MVTRNGTTFQSITAGSGSPAVIPATVDETTVVIVSAAPGGSSQVELPVAEIGDVVEVYRSPANYTLQTLPATGETIGGSSSPAGQSSNSGERFRKLTATDWGRLSDT
jgi:hypothetical protein